MRGQRFISGPFLLNPGNGTLLRKGEHVAVGRRGILLLAALLKRQGEIATEAEIMDAARPGTAVEESNLSVQIALLRKPICLAADGDEMQLYSAPLSSLLHITQSFSTVIDYNSDRQ